MKPFLGIVFESNGAGTRVNPQTAVLLLELVAQPSLGIDLAVERPRSVPARQGPGTQPATVWVDQVVCESIPLGLRSVAVCCDGD